MIFLSIISTSVSLASVESTSGKTVFTQNEEPMYFASLNFGKNLLPDFKNKFRFAREGTIIGGGFPLLAKTAQLGVKHLAKPVVGKTLNIAGKAIGEGWKPGGVTIPGISKMASYDKYVLPTMAKAIRKTIGWPAEKIISPLIISAICFQSFAFTTLRLGKLFNAF